MKARTLFSISILVLAVLITTGSCATTPKTKVERESFKNRVFMHSVRSGDFDNIKELIDEGLDVNTQDNDGCTALWFAIKNRNVDIEKLLREAGAKE
jgi:ankyrin repeat protein